MPNPRPLLPVLALGIVLNLPAGAEPGPIAIDAPWARATPPGAASAAGYLTIRNTGAVPDRLVAAASPRAERVEMHETAIADGVARMRPLPQGVDVAPGATVEFAPGGLHLMFRQPDGPFVAGQSVPVTLTFAEAGDRQVELPVVPIGAGPPAGDDDGHDAHR